MLVTQLTGVNKLLRNPLTQLLSTRDAKRLVSKVTRVLNTLRSRSVVWGGAGWGNCAPLVIFCPPLAFRRCPPLLNLLKFWHCVDFIEDFHLLNLNRICYTSINKLFKNKITRNLNKKIWLEIHLECKPPVKTYLFRYSRHVARCPHRSNQQLIWSVC